MDKVTVISVVRDFATYETCVAGNPHLVAAERVVFDNREKNEPIPVLYNRFLDSFDYSTPSWFVFCHEDFQPLEPFGPKLEGCDGKSLWGPVGARTAWRWGMDPHFTLLGRIHESSRDGSGLRLLGMAVECGTAAETLDCMCVAVHSSLVAAHNLRFDVRFPFDLYVEDFCVRAREKGVAARILPLACRHWSGGALGERYRAAERAFAEKWPSVCTTGTSSDILGGGANFYRRSVLAVKLLRRKLCASIALKGMGWSLAGSLFVKGVQFGFSIVLARLLCPDDFGLVGMVAIFMALSDIVLDGGLVAALIRKCERTEADYATVFWGKLASSAVAYVILFVCSPFVAAFYGRPELTAVMRVIAIGLVLAAASSVFLARLQISRRFRTLAAVSATAVLLSGAVGVALAWLRLGVWAVVGQGLAWQVFTLGLVVAYNRWLPHVCFSMASFRAFFDFGWKHMVRGALNSVYNNGYSLAIGKAFGAADLGLYNRADYYTGEIGAMVGRAVNEVNYPLLSQCQNDDAKLRQSYRRLLLLVAAVMIPGMAVFAVFAEPLIRFVIGPQWVPCVPYLRILACGAAFAPLVALTYMLMYVKGRTDLALKLELAEKPLAFGLLLAALPFGILAICSVKSVSTVLIFVVNACVVRKRL